MTVIGTVGLPGSGKGEFAAVARERGIPVVTMGDVIRAACRERGLDPEEHHGRVARALREEEGPAAIAERSLPRIREALDGADVVVVDGLRSDVELDRFEAAFGDEFLLVSIEAPFEARADRLAGRGRDDSDLDEEELRAREERELSFGMGEAMERADLTVDNTGSLDGYRSRVESILADPHARAGERSGTGGE
jgi:dephospho-CoA kinase